MNQATQNTPYLHWGFRTISKIIRFILILNFVILKRKSITHAWFTLLVSLAM